MTDQEHTATATPEHRLLEQRCGRWRVECTFLGGPEPMRTDAIETLEMFGPFFTVSRFEAELFGAPYRGQAVTGYEPDRQRWVANWIDTMSPNLLQFTGRYDAATRTLTMACDGPGPGGQGVVTYRSAERLVDDQTREFDMWMATPAGQEAHLLHYRYRRA